MNLAEKLAAGRLVAADVGSVELEMSTLWRVYSQPFVVTGFNLTGGGNARFSPLRVSDGAVVPTMYAGTTLAVALMETVLHDVPSPSAGFILPLKPATETRRVAQLKFRENVHLADFTSLGLRKLGLRRQDVIDCDKRAYPSIRKLAEWAYANRPDLQGIAWTSRQDDRAQAVVLFEPRLPPELLLAASSEQRFDEGPHLATLVDLVDRLGASLLIA